ncbi:MAG: F0F1 ATP synthase subunit delta [Xanthomonadaceae bacterium]|nr:F0F1 ATP synthase subunit delta [Xanthomonadaceae bacterium]
MAEITTIARPYAQAVFELAKAENDFAGWSDSVRLLAMIATDPEAAEWLASPRVGADQKAALLIDVGGDRLTPAAVNLVKVLAHNQRLPALAEIAQLYEALRNDAEGVVEAELISAQPASEEQQTRVTAALKARLGREVRLSCRTDAALLGGAVIRAGDLVIDGSARGKLGRLAGALTH